MYYFIFSRIHLIEYSTNNIGTIRSTITFDLCRVMLNVNHSRTKYSAENTGKYQFTSTSNADNYISCDYSISDYCSYFTTGIFSEPINIYYKHNTTCHI